MTAHDECEHGEERERSEVRLGALAQECRQRDAAKAADVLREDECALQPTEALASPVGLGRVRLHEGEGGTVTEAVGDDEGGELSLTRDRSDAPAAPGVGCISGGSTLQLQHEQGAAQKQRAACEV